MWKPGQLITICGEVYRVKRIHSQIKYVCIFCYFCDPAVNCILRIYNPKLRFCWDYIPDDCYFERVWPKSYGEQDKL